MEIFLLVIHIIISIVLVLLILAQTSKGNGLDSNLGGAASNVFGSSASEMLKKWTQIMGGLFLISCVFLAINVKSKDSGDAGLASSIPVENTEQASPTQDIDLDQNDIQENPVAQPNDANSEASTGE